MRPTKRIMKDRIGRRGGGGKSSHLLSVSMITGSKSRVIHGRIIPSTQGN